MYAGLRPLLSAGAQAETTELSREHAVLHPAPGLVAIAGGKYTTYRVMAADAVDAAAAELPGEVAPSSTAEIPLVGAEGFRELWAARVRTARRAGLDVTAVERLLRRHGDRTPDVLALVAADPALGAPLHPGGRVIRAEAVVAARDEGARSLADILVRRTRLAVQTRDRALSVARDTAALVTPDPGVGRRTRGDRDRGPGRRPAGGADPRGLSPAPGLAGSRTAPRHRRARWGYCDPPPTGPRALRCPA